MANEIITTLHPDTDPDIDLYPNIKKVNIPDGSIDNNKIENGSIGRIKFNSDVNSLLNSINELHPSGVDTSTNILSFTTNKGIYIGSDTGYWYYWDGTHYVSGGDYQANALPNGTIQNTYTCYIGYNAKILYKVLNNSNLMLRIYSGINIKGKGLNVSLTISDIYNAIPSSATLTNDYVEITIENTKALCYSVSTSTLNIKNATSLLDTDINLVANTGYGNLTEGLLIPVMYRNRDNYKRMRFYISNNADFYVDKNGNDKIVYLYNNIIVQNIYTSYAITLQSIKDAVGDSATLVDGLLTINFSNGKALTISYYDYSIHYRNAYDNSIPDDEIIIFSTAYNNISQLDLNIKLNENNITNLMRTEKMAFYLTDNGLASYYINNGNCYLKIKGILVVLYPDGSQVGYDNSQIQSDLGSSATIDDGLNITISNKQKLLFNVKHKQFRIDNKCDINDYVLLSVGGSGQVVDGALTTTILIKEIQNPETYFISSLGFYNANYDNKISEFNALVNNTNHIEKLLFFTDIHLSPYETIIKRLIGDVEKIYNSTDTDYVLCGGDWLTANDTQDVACDKLSRIKGFMNSKFKNSYMMVGNHDTNYQGRIDDQSLENTGILTQQTINNLWFKGNKSYYSFKEGISKCYVFDSGTDWDPDMNSYKWEQVNWFANQLLENDDDYNLIYTHIIYNSGSVIPITDNITKIAQAYNDKTTITLNSITYDFSNTNGYVKCCIGGHTHSDSNGILNDIPYIITRNAYESSKLHLDLILLDYDNNVAHCVRVGDGSNRDISLITGLIIE